MVHPVSRARWDRLRGIQFSSSKIFHDWSNAVARFLCTVQWSCGSIDRLRVPNPGMAQPAEAFPKEERAERTAHVVWSVVGPICLRGTR